MLGKTALRELLTATSGLLAHVDLWTPPPPYCKIRTMLDTQLLQSIWVAGAGAWRLID